MKIKMELKTDAIFGSGLSIPGGEDISVLCDSQGFPYYKGSTFKGIFREELYRYLDWIGTDRNTAEQKVSQLLGKSGDDTIQKNRKLVFSDFCLSDGVKKYVLKEIGTEDSQEVLNSFSHIRVFTGISEEGMAEEGTLRMGRCINKGMQFYSEIKCPKEEEELVLEVLHLIKWIGTMRNRGFGKVQISLVEQGGEP